METEDAMTGRSAAILAAAALGLLGLSTACGAHPGRSSGHFSGGHFAGVGGGFHQHFSAAPRFHSGPRFAPRVFIGGAVIAPFYFPPSYYYPPPPAYVAPPTPLYYYCQAYGAYYPQVQDCPGGWQVVPAS
jgi:hypothetical protein